MSFLNLFGKKENTIKRVEFDDLENYTGMRVEVTTKEGRMLFVGKLFKVNGNKAELHQYTEFEAEPNIEPISANIRGYNDNDKKAIYMEGMITPGDKHIWQVEELTLVRIGNDRAFFRLDTNIDATVTMFTGLEMGEKPCKLLNVSAGGACIGSEGKYYKGDKFLLKFKLIEERPMSAVYCQIMRVVEKENGKFEYGCRFLELTDNDQETIIKNVFAAQTQKNRP